MKLYKLIQINILVYIVMLFFFNTLSSAQVYSWVDAEGKLHFTNTIPPSVAGTVIADEEFTSSKEELEVRVNNKKIESEEKFEIQREKRRKRRELLLIKKKNEEILRNEKFKERRELFVKIRDEKNVLIDNMKIAQKKCDQHKGWGYVFKSNCQDEVQKRYKIVISTLNSSPQYYFQNTYRIERATEKFLENLYQ